jgi:hypothetical protein
MKKYGKYMDISEYLRGISALLLEILGINDTVSYQYIGEQSQP